MRLAPYPVTRTSNTPTYINATYPKEVWPSYIPLLNKDAHGRLLHTHLQDRTMFLHILQMNTRRYSKEHDREKETEKIIPGSVVLT